MFVIERILWCCIDYYSHRRLFIFQPLAVGILNFAEMKSLVFKICLELSFEFMNLLFVVKKETHSIKILYECMMVV